MAKFISVKVTGSRPVTDLFDDEDKKVTADLGADLIVATAVDTGELKGAWDIDVTACKISNAKPYANRIMNGGHSKQTPPGTLDALIDKYTRG